ncbi:MAG: pantoate--beta-alanine ligase, partial [Phycisphaerales bacterium]
MDVFTDIDACRSAVRDLHRGGVTVGLVPTMGALHEGHLSLIRTAHRRCDAVTVTIFVNPTQFGPNEDFRAYPRVLDSDLAACEAEGVDIVFTPDVEAMYPSDAHTTIHVDQLTDVLCGPCRPGHFDGVATVVAKLFQIVPADFAFFGEKDYQQLAVIQQMARDLNIPIEVVACPTVREPDGLAMSSRNAYL